MKSIIATRNAPGAIGPYNQGIVAKGTFLFTAGQIPLDPANGELTGSTITEQTRQALTNLKAVVEAGGSSLDRVVKTTVFLQNMADFAAMNAVYSEFFPKDAPARSAFEVAALPKGALVEIECVALTD